MNLKALRVAARISQEEAAQKLGVTRQSLSKWESGRYFPGGEYIVSMMDLYHCDPADMIAALAEINQIRQKEKRK